MRRASKRLGNGRPLRFKEIVQKWGLTQEPLLERLLERAPEQLVVLADRSAGLLGFLAIDDTRLGPAAGGIRTRSYVQPIEALEDALRLARAMTIKCSLAGLRAGGGKLVVLDHAGLDRARAFELIGARIEALGGLFRTAGDLGTTAADLAAVQRRTRFVHTDERGLAGAVARGLRRAIEAVVAVRRRLAYQPGIDLCDLKVAVQGAGAIGSAVAEMLASVGCEVSIADLDPARARSVAERTGAHVVTPDRVLFEPVDVIAPCAAGNVLDASAAEGVKAWAVCGAANNIIADASAREVLLRRGLLVVPDPIASAGAVIEGIGETVMGLTDRTSLIDRIGQTAHEILIRSQAEGRATEAIAVELAYRRIEQRAID